MTASVQVLKEIYTAGFSGFDAAEVEKAAALFNRWCPGLNEELQGFADSLQVPLHKILYFAMTYLRPNCSHLALLPCMTRSGRPLVARSYEFSHEAEDFTLVKTEVTGKYAHLGTSVLLFGRDDGLNEHGLSVTMSSCGFPVGTPGYMRRPKLYGLQFWAVIRALLENCRDVSEALEYISDMPVAYNLNLILADKNANIALVETLDGSSAIKRISSHDGSDRYICATNHPLLPELVSLEPTAMRHSLQRYEWLRSKLDAAGKITGNDLKEMLLSKYPDGLCCHFFPEYLGTTKSMVIDPGYGTIEICWGGRRENGWQTYSVHEPFQNSEHEIVISFDSFDPKLGEFIPLNK